VSRNDRLGALEDARCDRRRQLRSTQVVTGACVTLVTIATLESCTALKAPDESAAYDVHESGTAGDTAAGSDTPTEVLQTGAGDGSPQTRDASDVLTDWRVDVDASITDSDGDAAPPEDMDATDEQAEASADTADGAIDDASDDGNGADVSCIPDCPSLGQFRCGELDIDAGVFRQLQVCSLAMGCLQWLNTATCRADEACCEGGCRKLDTASACRVPPGFDYYVDAERGSDDVDTGQLDIGTPSRPFRTVSRAIAAANSVARPGRCIFVAPGVYDRTHGETFPLVLRGGASIYGAAHDRVTIRGSGELDHSSAGGVYNGIYQVTLVVGDDTATTTISGVTIVGANPPTREHHGVFCDRGGRPETGETVGATVIDNAVIGPGYQHGITAVSSDATDTSAESGCKLRMFGSTVTRTVYGVYATGCETGKTGFPVSLQIGDANRGNTFTRIGTPHPNPFMAEGWGILVHDCITQSSFRNNQFVDSTGGIAIDARGDLGQGVYPFSVEHNVFSNLSAFGFAVRGNSPSGILNENVFTKVSSAPTGVYRAIALLVEGEGGYLPLKKARRNTFVGNDLAIHVHSPAHHVTFAEGGPFDLGTPSDPGENKLLCNSMVGNPTTDPGGDIYLYLPGPGVVPLGGNVWDHFPPRSVSAAGAANGTDVTFGIVPSPTIDASGGRSDTTPCPIDRIPGPAPGDGGVR
jgi:hypothetical protein